MSGMQLGLWALAAMYIVLGIAGLMEDRSSVVGWIQLGGAVVMVAILLIQWQQAKQGAE